MKSMQEYLKTKILVAKANELTWPCTLPKGQKLVLQGLQVRQQNMSARNMVTRSQLQKADGHMIDLRKKTMSSDCFQ